MKKNTKKKKASFEKVKFIFDEYYLEVGLGKSQEMMFMGFPIKFSANGKTATVDMHLWLVGIDDRYRERYKS